MIDFKQSSIIRLQIYNILMTFETFNPLEGELDKLLCLFLPMVSNQHLLNQ